MSVLRLLLLLLGLVIPGAGLASPLDYGARVVTLSVTQQTYDERRPWAKTNPRTSGASAVVVEGPLLLTEAQMIADATLIRVEKHGVPDRVPARVVHVDPEIDLALLAVDEPGFFEDLETARVAAFAPTRGSARTVRWRNRQLEVSDGSVTSIEVRNNRYGTIEHAFLLLTTDLTGGGWSEPVFGEEDLIGLTVAQEGQVASVVPAEIIGAYLARARNAEAYRGFASIGAGWQNNRDPALSSYLGLAGRPRGVVITQIPWGTSACGVLEERDILLSLDGYPIDTLGNYRHPRYGRLRFTHLAAADHQPGDVVPVQVFRGGELLDLELELRRYPSQALLIPWRRDNIEPAYLVAGGLVFRELDGAYLRSWDGNANDAPSPDLVNRLYLERHGQQPGRRRILILSYVLPAPYNLGYHDLANLAVRKVNGREVDSIAGLAQAFEQPVDGFHTIEFHPNRVRAEVVLDAAGFEAATAGILEAFAVPRGLRPAAQPPPELGPECPVEEIRADP
jgi:hypothetical protein